jgi:hypothetical protein
MFYMKASPFSISTCIVSSNHCDTVRSGMNLRHLLFVCLAGLLLFTGGCSSFYGPHGLGQLVLLVWKITPAQKDDAQQRANRYFAKVAHHEKPRPRGRYVALQTLDPTPEQKQKYLKSRATALEKSASEGKPLGSEWVDPSQLHCIMVFDVVTHVSVAPSCYVVGTLPKIGDINTYETVPAEFIAASAE